ncbi:hypothetical protein GCM10010266_68170 [Streptomyces griseomycini]|uniref:Uncharacterized protein n=1 Tax=Streptomyces griseomycini TaxID=66895 RepID=A0A7W7PWM7_9ACTN|nr:hypothetical protein [Streptomyces griseomycini]GGQ35124.1 hypothetical protein GCM10010266_68170 [Streptomyces griseomycini]GGR54845.1 hypothetical protein GCM10015536_70220 [Streptomyces griseomycini]
MIAAARPAPGNRKPGERPLVRRDFDPSRREATVAAPSGEPFRRVVLHDEWGKGILENWSGSVA